MCYLVEEGIGLRAFIIGASTVLEMSVIISNSRVYIALHKTKVDPWTYTFVFSIVSSFNDLGSEFWSLLISAIYFELKF